MGLEIAALDFDPFADFKLFFFTYKRPLKDAALLDDLHELVIFLL